MSWLFDRLTDLAVADRLRIVVDTAERVDRDPVHDPELDVLLRRAELLPGTTVVRGAPPLRSVAVDDRREAVFVACGTERAPSLFAGLGERDLTVAVGAHAPGASVKVDALEDLASLLDALVTLRSYVHRIPA